MIIYLVRHGETNWNKEGRVQGSENIPLNEYGIELAEITSEKMKEIPVEVIFSSPLIRAQKTAEIMKRDRMIEIITDARLREMGFGKGEGTLIKEAAADENNPLHNFISAPERYAAKDGEDFSDVIARARSFMKEVLLPAQGKYKNVMLTAHGAFIRCFIRCIEERPLSEFWKGVPQRNCAVTIIELKNDRFTILEEGRTYY